MIDFQEKKRASLQEHVFEFLENLQAVETEAERQYMIHQWKTETRAKVLAANRSWWRMFLIKRVVKQIDRIVIKLQAHTNPSPNG